jgi:hypothetical protein
MKRLPQLMECIQRIDEHEPSWPPRQIDAGTCLLRHFFDVAVSFEGDTRRSLFAVLCVGFTTSWQGSECSPGPY